MDSSGSDFEGEANGRGESSTVLSLVAELALSEHK